MTKTTFKMNILYYIRIAKFIRKSNKRTNIILTISFFLFLAVSINIFDPYIQKYNTYWLNELNQQLTPEIQLEFEGKLNESFIYWSVVDIINDTFSADTLAPIDTFFSINTLSRSYFNISWSMENSTYNTFNSFQLIILNDYLLDKLTFSVNDTSAIVSLSLFEQIQNSTTLWFQIDNEANTITNISVSEVVDKEINLSSYFSDMMISFSTEMKWLIISYAGFERLIENINPIQWINIQKEDVIYSTFFAINLNLSKFETKIPYNALKQFNLIFESFINKIYTDLLLILENQSYSGEDDSETYLIPGFRNVLEQRIHNLISTIQPFFISTLFLFTVIQIICLWFLSTIIKTLFERNLKWISFSLNRGVQRNSLKSGYLVNLIIQFLTSFNIFLAFQILFYYKFTTYFSWKYLHLLTLIILSVIAVATIGLCYKGIAYLNSIIYNIFAIKRQRKSSRSEKILSFTRYSLLLLIPISASIIIITSQNLLNLQILPSNKIIVLSFSFFILTFILIQLPKRILHFVFQITNYLTKKFSTIFIYIRKSISYIYKQKKNFSVLLFFLLFCTNISLLYLDSTTSFKQKQIESSYGLDCTIVSTLQHLETLNTVINPDSHFIIYELPKDEFISHYYLLETPKEYFNGAFFEKEYFLKHSNADVFDSLENNNSYAIISTTTKEILNVEISDNIYPYIEIYKNNLSFVIFDFAPFLPIISTNSKDDSWIITNYRNNPLSSLVDNNTIILFSFEIADKELIEQRLNQLVEIGIPFTLINDTINPFVIDSGTQQNFFSKQTNLTMVFFLLFSVLTAVLIIYYSFFTEKSLFSYFSLHGYKPTNALRYILVYMVISLFLIITISFVTSLGTFALILYSFAEKKGLNLTVHLTGLSMSLIILPLVVFLLIYIIIGKRLFTINLKNIGENES